MNAPLPSFWGGLTPDRQARLRSALALLHTALADARQDCHDPWQFALTATELLAVGLQVVDLRWLVARGVAHHAEEKSRPGCSRSFRPACPLSVVPRSCFVLTEDGVRLHDDLAAGSATPVASHAVKPDRPCWDRDKRMLCWRGELVKRLFGPARHQELILTAFEEDGWPARIDDPLPGGISRTAARRRLYEAIRNLNRGQGRIKVRFGRDGTGQGACWAA
jgi:hypothetical protein